MNRHPYTGEELLKMWQDSGLSQRKFAKKIGMNFDQMHGLIFRAQKVNQEFAEKIELYEENNGFVAESKSRRITTLDQLIEACQIDLEEWIIERHVINKWEVGANLKDGKITVEPLFQVKAWLTKRHPEPVEPVIRPVEIQSRTRSYYERMIRNVDAALILSDIHFGFKRDIRTGRLDPMHDRRALSIALQIAQLRLPETIVVMGDAADLAEWSERFVRTPEMYWTTQPMLIELAWFLGQLRATTKKLVLLEGNHEERLPSLILRQMVQAYDLRPVGAEFPALSMPHLLGLDKLDVEYIGDYPNGEYWLNDDVVCIHGNIARAKSGATVSALAEDTQVTKIFGHIHRQELASKTLWERKGPRVVQAFSPGCLCRIDGAVPGYSQKANWQQGIGIVEYDKTGWYQIEPIPIHEGKAYWNGDIKAFDYLPRLREDTGWDF